VTNGSAVSWQHINLLGEYDFSEEKLQDTVGIKPPKLADQRAQFLGVAKKNTTPRPGTALYKILFRIWYLCLEFNHHCGFWPMFATLIGVELTQPLPRVQSACPF
jgi:hypothetical protein